MINTGIYRSTQELEALAALAPQPTDSFKTNIMFILKYRLGKNVKDFKRLMTLKNNVQIDILSRSSTKKAIPADDFNGQATLGWTSSPSRRI